MQRPTKSKIHDPYATNPGLVKAMRLKPAAEGKLREARLAGQS
jgi:hypothetical protein